MADFISILLMTRLSTLPNKTLQTPIQKVGYFQDCLVHSNILCPPLYPWIQVDLIRKRVRLARRDRGYVIFVSVNDRDDLERSLVKCRFHGAHHFHALFSAYISFCVVSCFDLRGSKNLPVSVFGVARVTSSLHISQHISSSCFPPVPNHPMPPPFRRLFSKN